MIGSSIAAFALRCRLPVGSTGDAPAASGAGSPLRPLCEWMSIGPRPEALVQSLIWTGYNGNPPAFQLKNRQL